MFYYFSCLFHGCERCFPNRKTCLPGGTVTVEEAFQRTLKREAEIKEKGFKMEIIWECELKIRLQSDSELKERFNSIEIPTPLKPRDALYGELRYFLTLNSRW